MASHAMTLASFHQSPTTDEPQWPNTVLLPSGPVDTEGYPYRLLSHQSIMLSETDLLHIEDLYVLTDGLRWVIVELEAQLRALTTSASWNGSLPQHIDRASQIWNEVFRLLDTEDIFGYWTSEQYIESRTVENFHDIPYTLTRPGSASAPRLT
jgi:hypothetical protein